MLFLFIVYAVAIILVVTTIMLFCREFHLFEIGEPNLQTTSLVDTITEKISEGNSKLRPLDPSVQVKGLWKTFTHEESDTFYSKSDTCEDTYYSEDEDSFYSKSDTFHSHSFYSDTHHLTDDTFHHSTHDTLQEEYLPSKFYDIWDEPVKVSPSVECNVGTYKVPSCDPVPVYLPHTEDFYKVDTDYLEEECVRTTFKALKKPKRSKRKFKIIIPHRNKKFSGKRCSCASCNSGMGITNCNSVIPPCNPHPYANPEPYIYDITACDPNAESSYSTYEPWVNGFENDIDYDDIFGFND